MFRVGTQWFLQDPVGTPEMKNLKSLPYFVRCKEKINSWQKSPSSMNSGS